LLSIIFVLKKGGLQSIFEKSIYLKTFWLDLKNLDEKKRWLYLADKLPKLHQLNWP